MRLGVNVNITPAKFALTFIRIYRIHSPTFLTLLKDGVAGPEFVRVAARNKLDRNKLNAISKDVSKLTPEIRQKIEEKLWTGKLTNPEQVKREAHRLSGQAIPKSKLPPDFHEVLIDWVAFIRGWRKQLHTVEPYREYIDSDPVTAEMFRKEVAGLIEDLQRLL